MVVFNVFEATLTKLLIERDRRLEANGINRRDETTILFLYSFNMFLCFVLFWYYFRPSSSLSWCLNHNIFRVIFNSLQN